LEVKPLKGSPEEKSKGKKELSGKETLLNPTKVGPMGNLPSIPLIKGRFNLPPVLALSQP